MKVKKSRMCKWHMCLGDNFRRCRTEKDLCRPAVTMYESDYRKWKQLEKLVDDYFNGDIAYYESILLERKIIEALKRVKGKR